MKRKLRVAVLVHPSLLPPDSIEGLSEQQWYDCKTEYDVVSTLRELGHDVRPLGIANDIQPLRDLIDEWRPNLAFNLLEEFAGRQELDHHVVALPEMRGLPSTGWRRSGLIPPLHKVLPKQLL